MLIADLKNRESLIDLQVAPVVTRDAILRPLPHVAIDVEQPKVIGPQYGRQGMFVAGHLHQRDRFWFSGDSWKTMRSPEAAPEPSRRNGRSLCRRGRRIPTRPRSGVDIRCGVDNLQAIASHQRVFQRDRPILIAEGLRARSTSAILAASYQVTAMAGLSSDGLKRARTSAILAGAPGY